MQATGFLFNTMKLKKRLSMCYLVFYITTMQMADNEFLPGQVYHVKPGTVHRFGANESHVELMEVSTNHLDDVVRLADDYKR